MRSFLTAVCSVAAGAADGLWVRPDCETGAPTFEDAKGWGNCRLAEDLPINQLKNDMTFFLRTTRCGSKKECNLRTHCVLQSLMRH